jgi:hypothetical protein
MWSLLERGWTLTAIGVEHGLTRERVRQIVGNFGHRELGPNQAIAARFSLQIVEQWKAGKTNRQIATALDIPLAAVVAIGLRANYRYQQHGTLQSYRRGCKCDACRTANSQHTKSMNARLRTQGRCVRCGGPSPLTWVCAACVRKNAESRAKKFT